MSPGSSAKNRKRRAKRRLWLLNRGRKAPAGRAKRREKLFRRREEIWRLLHLDAVMKKRVRLDKANRLTMPLPAIMDFERSHDETCAHLRVLRTAVENGIRIRLLDFSEVREISTAAALVLVSTVDQWRERVRGRLKADWNRWDAGIARLLCQMGYCEALKIRPPRRKWAPSTLNFLPFTKGRTGGDEDPGPKAKEVRIGIETMISGEVERPELFEGLSEAMVNVGHHAYFGVSDESRKYWWASASFNASKKQLQITFYDRGHGIPVRITKNTKLERFWDKMQRWTHSQRIAAAMRLGKTSTMLPGRGKGLKNLLAFAKVHSAGRIQIRSLRGMYEEQYVTTANSGTRKSVRSENFAESIGGTLIEWTVTL